MAERYLLHVLPGGNGDALLVEYGDDEHPRRVLVDGGVEKSAPAVAALLGPGAALELLVVTHIDNDHIGGVLPLLARADHLRPGEVWFNAFRHLPLSRVEQMGPIAGERLTTLIRNLGLPWNTSFDGGAVALAAAPAPPPVRTLPGGLRCTVLSPGPAELARLRRDWVDVVRAAGLDPDVPPPAPPPAAPGLERMGPLAVAALAERRTPADTSVANGSSIALLVEFANRRLLLSGDAHADVLIEGIDRLVGAGGTLEVDVFKLPHHGSKANVTSELLHRVRATSYVFSTDGSGNQRHPNDEAVARVIHYADRPSLAFNYRSRRTLGWDDEELKDRWAYSTVFPPDDRPGRISIDLMALPSRSPAAPERLSNHD